MVDWGHDTIDDIIVITLTRQELTTDYIKRASKVWKGMQLLLFGLCNRPFTSPNEPPSFYSLTAIHLMTHTVSTVYSSLKYYVYNLGTQSLCLNESEELTLRSKTRQVNDGTPLYGGWDMPQLPSMGAEVVEGFAVISASLTRTRNNHAIRP